ncbi:MAG TPA: transglutaminase-like domain-containing protein [Ktedonobacteraceae bacterium]|jgi:regulator of sirC expression with transglutaminase-like and TPR domain
MSEEFKAARERARQAFIALITEDDSRIDLARAALLIAAEEYPALDIEHYLTRLAELAERVRLYLEPRYLPTSPTTKEEYLGVLSAMNVVLFEQERLRGNRIDYHNPQNSFLNRVLERRLGIPLTLSLIYMEVGKRLGLQIAGIGMPFHFLVRCSFAQDEPLYIDPYEKGRFLSARDCRQQLSRIFKNERDFDPSWLEPLGARQLLIRMLTNLKHIYIHRKDFRRALVACDRILLLNPALATELRDRGVVHFHLKRYARALHDLGAYLELVPEADDSAEIRQQIKIIRQLLAMMN